MGDHLPSPNIHIKVPPSLLRKIKKINAPRDELKSTTREAVLTVQGEIPGYPPKPKGSTYDRTGTLGRTVTSLQGEISEALGRVESIGGGFIGFIGSSRIYAPYVISEEFQTKSHKSHGWYTLENVLKQSKGRIIKLYEDLIKRLSS